MLKSESAHPYRTAAIGLAVTGLALAMRLPGLIDPRFWQDEMISLGVAGGGFFETLTGALRFSAHPPAYYAQLNLWMLGGKNASYILLNSVLWSAGAVAAIFFLGRQILGEKTAALSAVLLAIMPQSLFFAQNARMYSMILMLQILGWWCAEHLAAASHSRERGFWRALGGLCLAQLLTGYAHAIGPVFSACLGLFALARLLEAGAPRSTVKTFLGIQTGLGAVLALVLLNGLMRETQHEPPADLAAVMAMFTQLLFGPGLNAFAWGAAAMLVYVLSAAAVFAEARLRMAALVLMLLPIGTSLITTLTLKPILAVRPLALTLPFIAMCCAATLIKAHAAARRRLSRAGVWALGLIVLAGFLASSLMFMAHYEKPHDFRAAAADLAREAMPGDAIIAIESPTILWGLSWYLAGPETVSALRVQSPPNVRWQALYDRLGEDYTALLGLKAETDTLMWHGTPIIMGEQGVDKALAHKRIWLAYYGERDPSGASGKLLNTGRIQASSKNYRGLTIVRFDTPD